MREIKFRTWDKAHKKMYYQSEFDFHLYADGTFDIDIVDINDNYMYSLLSEHIELMGIVGLKDRNGKEIYEGDIVQVYDDEIGRTNHLVTWGNSKENNDYPSFTLDYGEHDENTNSLQLAYLEYTIEVIGNIYENPNLIK